MVLRALEETRGASSAVPSAALAAAAEARPIVVRDAGVGWDVGWDDASLARQLGGVRCHVLAAPRESSRFTYFWGGAGDSVHDHYASPPTVHSVGMQFSEFSNAARLAAAGGGGTDASLYLQMPLVKRLPSGETFTEPVPGRELRGALQSPRPCHTAACAAT